MLGKNSLKRKLHDQDAVKKHRKWLDKWLLAISINLLAGTKVN